MGSFFVQFDIQFDIHFLYKSENARNFLLIYVFGPLITKGHI